jgi:hypothetical protein
MHTGDRAGLVRPREQAPPFRQAISLSPSLYLYFIIRSGRDSPVSCPVESDTRALGHAVSERLDARGSSGGGWAAASSSPAAEGSCS